MSWHSAYLVMQFQSTLSQGERRGRGQPFQPGRCISIHALARRATSREQGLHVPEKDFNPRSRKESDSYI